jgi:hypothetical protein
LVDRLTELEVTGLTMEANSDYWKSPGLLVGGGVRPAEKHRIEKPLEDAQIRLSVVATDVSWRQDEDRRL